MYRIYKYIFLNIDERNKRSKQIEGYSMFIDWKTQYFLGVSSTQFGV